MTTFAGQVELASRQVSEWTGRSDVRSGSDMTGRLWPDAELEHPQFDFPLLPTSRRPASADFSIELATLRQRAFLHTHPHTLPAFLE